MKRILLSIAATAVALGTPASAKAQALEGKWTNPKRSVIVNVARCGEAYCGTVSWASDKNKAKVSENGRKLIGTRILSDLRPAGNGLVEGEARPVVRRPRHARVAEEHGGDERGDRGGEGGATGGAGA